MATARTVLEKLVRGSAFVRRLPKEFGRARVTVTADAALSFLKPGAGAFPEGLLRFVARYVTQGAHVWDVGANVGVFTVAAAMKAGVTGSVVAFEPDPVLSGLLRRTVQLEETGRAPISVVPLAIADGNGLARFQIARRGRVSNALEGFGRSQAGGVRETQFVPTATLDSMLDTFPPPSVLKIDVEGAEALVLQGARRLLEGSRPVIHAEVGAEAERIVRELLDSYNYRLFDPSKENMQEVKRCVFDTVALPAERFTETGAMQVVDTPHGVC